MLDEVSTEFYTYNRNPILWDARQNFIDLVASKLYMVPIAIALGTVGGLLSWVLFTIIVKTISFIVNKISPNKDPNLSTKSKDIELKDVAQEDGIKFDPVLASSPSSHGSRRSRVFTMEPLPNRRYSDSFHSVRTPSINYISHHSHSIQDSPHHTFSRNNYRSCTYISPIISSQGKIRSSFHDNSGSIVSHTFHEISTFRKSIDNEQTSSKDN